MSDNNTTSNKLFIGNLNYDITAEDLKEAFSKYSEVLSAKVITDRDSGKSKGFAFVEFPTAEDAEKVKTELNEAEFAGRTIYIDFAREKKEA